MVATREQASRPDKLGAQREFSSNPHEYPIYWVVAKVMRYFSMFSIAKLHHDFSKNRIVLSLLYSGRY